MKGKNEMGTEHCAIAKAQNISVSTKHSVEISNFLRYKSTGQAKKMLEEVIGFKRAVPFKRYNQDMPHRRGDMASGRYPQKAAKEFLKLVKVAEANAQVKGLNASSLKIVKLIANKASIPFSGGRHRRGTKRTHLEIMVREMSSKKDEKKESKGSASRVHKNKENKEQQENKAHTHASQGQKEEQPYAHVHDYDVNKKENRSENKSTTSGVRA